MQSLSARAENATAMADECPFVYVAQLLGAHWRPTILWKIAGGIVSYNALRRAIEPITDKMLASDLSALVERGLIIRRELSIKPRRSRYELTARGESLIPVLRMMQQWVENDVRGGDRMDRLHEGESSSC